MNKLTKEISENSISHGSLPFWSWNDKLEESELRRQIRNMHDLKINGFFMHARSGLITEYLSEEWYNAIKVSIDEAKKLGMQAWSYDENGWPSGFAGGKLLKDPDNHSVYLKHQIVNVFPENTDDIYAIYALDGTKKPVKCDKPVNDCEKYLLIYCKTDDSYVDTLRDDVTEKFIAETHAQYQKILGKDFGTAMPGFFTDEPQYYRWATPFSKCMDKWFSEDYGYSVLEAIPALFVDYEGAESYRYDFYKLINKKFYQNFAKKIYDWADANGIKITGHFIEEGNLYGQMLCCGSIMPLYECEHIPGIDYLGRGIQTPLAGKQLGSACAQLGKKAALSEMFACCGWDVSPTELKHIADLQYADGVNIMCQHLYPYSERGQRKRDYPAHYSDHNPWQSYSDTFNEYYNNLGYMLSLGKEDVNTLVIHPIQSAWLTYKRIQKAASVERLEKDFRELFCTLSDYQIPYHFGEENMMQRFGSVKNGKLVIGQCEYDTVILPAIDTLYPSTVSLLKEFASEGGKIYTSKNHLPVYLDGKKAAPGTYDFLCDCENILDPEIFERFTGNYAFTLRSADLKNVRQIHSMVRATSYGKLYYFTNLCNTKFENLTFKSKDVKKLGLLDIQTLEMKPLKGKTVGNGCEVTFDLDGSESVVFCEYEAPDFLPVTTKSEERTISLAGNFTFAELPENLMTLDRAQVSFDGVDFSDKRPIERIRDNLLKSRYKGKVWIKYSFETSFIPEKLSVVIEKPSVIGLNVNGNDIGLSENWWFDRYFSDTDIAKYTVIGKNEVTICIDYYQNDYVYHVLYDNVMESLRNCLVFDTEIEAAYLKGSFRIGTDISLFTSEPANGVRYHATEFVLEPEKKEIDVTNIVKDGYPFYGGKIKVKTELDFKSGDPTLLKLDGRFAVATVEVNGKYAGKIMFSKYLELSDFLKEGKNELVITLCNAYRNLLGPHHGEPAEPTKVRPTTFSFEKMWDDDKCPSFVPEYAFVRYGINL